MRSRLFRIAFSCAGFLAAPVGLSAQSSLEFSTPSCEEAGIARVLLSVPPGQNRDSLKASIQRGEIFPEGTHALLLPEGHGPQLRNSDAMGQRARNTLGRLLFRGMKIDGSTSVLLTISAEGKVTAVNATTGNRELDRALARLWTEADFEPPVVGGCRVVTWYHVPVAFASDFSLDEQRLEMSTQPSSGRD